ncbi:MAG: hypothetical protein PHC88_03815 [Terrimicrobiaceae bacterium]|nr:hypothetical protein [Terrimicrobiaceae bacterium]
MNAKWKMLAYAAAIFVAGGLAGGILGLNLARHSVTAIPSQSEIAQKIREHLQSRAGLSSDQIQKIDATIETTAARLEAIHRETMRQVGAIFVEFHARIAGPAALSAEQRRRLAQIESEHRQRLNNPGK